MADPIGLASGLLTLALFALQSGTALYNTIQSFQSHPKRVRDLVEELQALNEVLAALHSTVESSVITDFSALDLPLLRCGKACEDFGQELQKCSSRSKDGRTSFRDWARLKYMGDDLDGFRRLLAGYKLTINIALTDASLRKSCLTLSHVEEYKNLINVATNDLQAHLEGIDDKLNDIVQRTLPESGADGTELKSMREERLSAIRCLQICNQLSQHIDQMHPSPTSFAGRSETDSTDTISEKITTEGLQGFKTGLALTISKLERHLNDVTDKLITKSKAALSSEDDIAEYMRLRDQLEAAQKCIEVCSQADQHLKENVSTIDNYAVGDAVQFMVSTNGKILHGKNRGLGWRTRQVGGYLSDEAVLQLSRDMLTNSSQSEEKPSLQRNTSVVQEDVIGAEPASDFDERHGRGIKLMAKCSPDSATPLVISQSSPPKR